MKKHGGLIAYLNQTTTQAAVNDALEEIIYVDIDDLEESDENFYGIREIESLAGMISTSNYLEPLSVIKKENGQYKIWAGHRRRAAILLLMERGQWVENKKIPCIRKKFKAQGVLSAEEIGICSFIFSNRGQRQNRTIEEKLEELRLLQPIARKIWKSEKEKGRKGNFRAFFAQEVLEISPATLQRLSSLEKLVPAAKEAVNQKHVSETAAAKLATLPPAEQEAYIFNLKDGRAIGTVKDIPSKNSEKAQDGEENEKFEPDPESEHGISPADRDSVELDVQLAEPVENKVNLEEKTPKQSMYNFADAQAAAETEANNWFLKNLQSILQHAIQMMAKEKAQGNGKSAAQWDLRRARISLVMAIIKEQ